MPELPEVETIRRDLGKVLVGKKITGVEILDKKIVSVASVIPTERSEWRNPLKPVKTGDFVIALKDKKIISVERRGKLLAFKLNSGKYLLAHMKMTGQLIYVPLSLRVAKRRSNLVAGGHQVGKNDLQVPNKFTRVIIVLRRVPTPALPLSGEGAVPPPDKGEARRGTRGGTLYFNDLRRFGYLKLVDKDEKEKIFKNSFGIEPLTSDFKLSAFVKLFSARKTNLKAILMNQKLISGLGNIYVDEACFSSGLLPWRAAASLTQTEIKKLFSCIQKVMKVAVNNRGTTFKDFRDGAGEHGKHHSFLNVYGRAKEQCRKCKNLIKKIKHAGRGTHYCEKCQK